jgi:hypothetical protein
MKKPSHQLWDRQRRLARYRMDERKKRFDRHWTPRGQRYVVPGEIIVAPGEFNLIKGGGTEVVKFLRAVADRVLTQSKPVQLDFRRTRQFHVPGAIYLYAELDRIISLSSLAKPITIRDPRARKPREVLKQIGLYELTRDKCEIVPQFDDVIYWRTTKGSDQSGDKLQLLEPVAEKANASSRRHVAVGDIWRGISEAVANTVDHAYIKPRSDRHGSHPEVRWWMFTQLKDARLTAAVCDLGCGYSQTIDRYIPETVIAQFKQLIQGANADALAIQTAMEYGRSGTRQGHRGKGSRDAISVLDKHGAGELVILSNSGWVRYVFQGGKQTGIFSEALGIDIRGTIVWWNLGLE